MSGGPPFPTFVERTLPKHPKTSGYKTGVNVFVTQERKKECF